MSTDLNHMLADPAHIAMEGMVPFTFITFLFYCQVVYVDLGEIRVQTLLVSKVKYSYCNSIMLLRTFQLTFETSGLIILAKMCVFVARIFSFSHMVRP